MIYSSQKFSLDSFLKELHSTAIDIKGRQTVNIHALNEKFSYSSIHEIIALAKILTCSPDTQEFSRRQLVNDVAIITNYISKGPQENTQNYFYLNIFSFLFWSPPTSVITHHSVEELLDFLNEFAPMAAFQFRKQLHQKKAFILYEEVIQEIESHFKEITEALGFRLYHLDSYLTPNSYNKLLNFQRIIALLIKLINEKGFKDTPKASLLVSKALGCLKAHQAYLSTVSNRIQKELIRSQCKKIHGFLESISLSTLDPNSLDNMQHLDTLKRIKNQLSALAVDFFHTKLQQQCRSNCMEDWLAAMLVNPSISIEAIAFSNRFCQEAEHVKKMHHLQTFLTDWCNKYPPQSSLDADELIRAIQAIFLQTKSPEFLLNVLLLESDTISYAPNPDLPKPDYALEEMAAGKGIQFYNLLNLTNAFTVFCGTAAEFREKQPVPVNENWITKFKITHAWQHDLINNKGFCSEAIMWGYSFCAEKNGIYKLNQHRAATKRLQEVYAEFTLFDEKLQLPFLIALILASANPRIFVAYAEIDEKSIGWKVCEGFIDDTPVNAHTRLKDYKTLKQLIRL